MQEARKEHLEILDCLLQQDFELAAAKMRTHVAGCRNAAMDFFLFNIIFFLFNIQ